MDIYWTFYYVWFSGFLPNYVDNITSFLEGTNWRNTYLRKDNMKEIDGAMEELKENDLSVESRSAILAALKTMKWCEKWYPSVVVQFQSYLTEER